MSVQRHGPVSRVVLGRPGQEKLEVGVLHWLGGVLVRFPGTVQAVFDAALKPRIQEDEKRLKAQRHFDQGAVAASDILTSCGERLGGVEWN